MYACLDQVRFNFIVIEYRYKANDMQLASNQNRKKDSIIYR